MTRCPTRGTPQSCDSCTKPISGLPVRHWDGEHMVSICGSCFNADSQRRPTLPSPSEWQRLLPEERLARAVELLVDAVTHEARSKPPSVCVQRAVRVAKWALKPEAASA